MRFIVCFILVFYSTILSAQNNRQRNQHRQAPPGRQNTNPQLRTNSKENFTRRFKELREEFDSTDFNYAILLSDNAGIFGGKRSWETKGKYLQMAGMISNAIESKNLTEEENANVNLEIGRLSYATGRFVLAEKRFVLAKSLFEKAGLVKDTGYFKTISGLALLYTSMGRFLQAAEFYKLVFDYRKTNIPDSEFPALLNNQAVFFFNTGLYNEAEMEFNKALSLLQKGQQKSSMEYAIVLNNQAILLQSIGRGGAAIAIMQQAVKISAALESSKAKNHLKFYSNLALIYQQANRYNEADSVYTILKTELEKGKSELANALNNAAILHLVMGKEEKVEEMLKSASSIYKSNLGENSTAFAKTTSDLGNYYRYKNRNAEAKPLLEKALQVREQTLGLTHPLYVQSLEDLALLYWKQKDFTKASSLYNEVMEKSIDFINRYFPPMSEAEKTKYWDLLEPRFQRYSNFAIEASTVNKELLVKLFEYRIATKGLLLNSSIKLGKSIFNSTNEDLRKEYTAWLKLREELAALYSYSKEELTGQNINIDSLQAAANTLEKKLSAASADFDRFYFSEKIKLADISKKLEASDAMVEIIRLRFFDQSLTDSIQYAGLIIDKNSQIPKLVILSNGQALENVLIKNYQRSIKKKTADEQSYTAFWKLFDPELNGKKKIYISFDGVYNQLNLNTLKKPAGDYLLHTYDFVLIGNASDLLNEKTKTPALKTATLIGYPDFDSENIPELPGTKTEVEQVNILLTGSGYRVKMLLEQEASETNLKIAKNVSILHIATHGYFLEDVKKTFWPIGVHADNAQNNVLLRSGLMFSHVGEANRHPAGLDNTDNGIMTAYEAMSLNLIGTNLVVLSACETGLGEIKAGEGVYGLQRAFLEAGAEAIIMSLWKVDDVATQQLMKFFYENWIKSGDRQKAFQLAQQQLMAIYHDPYYWGAFVMMGK
jgi:CHAT domain-containing protein